MRAGQGPLVAGDDLQEVVRIAEEPLGLQDIGDRGDGLFEGFDGVTVGVAHGDEDEGFEGQAQGLSVELCPVVGGGTGLACWAAS